MRNDISDRDLDVRHLIEVEEAAEKGLGIYRMQIYLVVRVSWRRGYCSTSVKGDCTDLLPTSTGAIVT